MGSSIALNTLCFEDCGTHFECAQFSFFTSFLYILQLVWSDWLLEFDVIRG